MIARLVLALLVAGLSVGPAAAADDALDDLLTELRMVPLGDQLPSPFTLKSFDGRPLALGDLRGRAVFLYFWEAG